MARTEAYDKDQIAELLSTYDGNKSLVARKLGCDISTITRYEEKYPEIRKAIKDGKVRMIDKAEGNMSFFMSNQDHPKCYHASRFILETIGKERGYGANVSISFDTSQGEVIAGLDMDRLTDKEQAMLVKLVEKARVHEDEDPDQDPE